MENIIRKERLINSSIERVWNALTKSDEIAQWFLPNEFDAKVGRKFKLTHMNEAGTKEKSVSGEIIEIEKPNTLVYSWNTGEGDGLSKVTWTLKEESGKTLVVIEHVGFEVYGDKMDETKSHHIKGWEMFFGNFQSYCENE
jgi:uncharacterized protein YndB with AHSA1/START domain